MRTSQASSLLVAALVVLRHPCSRNKATAQLLLQRAAEHEELSPAERDACRSLADELDYESAEQPRRPPMGSPARPAANWDMEHRLNIMAAALPFAPPRIKF